MNIGIRPRNRQARAQLEKRLMQGHIWETEMDTAAVTTLDQAELSTVSWPAVIAGAVASAALTLFLLALGVGIGFSIVSPWGDEGVSATTFHVSAGIYLVAVAMLASAVGGYLSGRLRARWANVHNDEIYFRDTAHGLLTWALATVLGASVLGGATTHILAGASAGLAPAASVAANQTGSTDNYVDMLLRRDPAPATPTQLGVGSSPSQASDAPDLSSTRDELGRLLGPALRKGGDISPANRTYVAKVVAARTGLSQAEAERRVSEVITQAKQTADEARKATAKLMLWLAGSMLAGALAAMLGATEGGVLRDSKWYEPGWRAVTVRNH
jgi:hypothetical protein